MTVDDCLDGIWKELTSGSRMTERKREAQSAFNQIREILKQAEETARYVTAAGNLRAAFRDAGVDYTVKNPK